MDKMANVPITIFVIGVFILCTLAVLSFVVVRSHAVDIFSSVVLMEKINSQVESYSVNANVDGFDTRFNSNRQTVLYQEKIDHALLPWNDDKVIFSVEYPLS